MTASLEVLGWALLHSVWQGALVATGLWLFLRWTAASAVRVRYAAALIGLVVLVSLPVLNYRQTMELWRGHRSWVLVTAERLVRSELATRGKAEVGEIRAELRRREAAEWPGVVAVAPDGQGRGAARVLGLLWLLAAAGLGGRLAAEQRRVLRFSETGAPDEGWRRSAVRVAARLDLPGAPRVRITDRVEVPALVGWRWPVVLIPRSAASLSEEARDAVLAHELAHVGRGDYLVNLLQALVEAVLFYSPAAWWVSARIREERECCCDDTAVRALRGGAVAYIQALLALETGRANPRPALALNGGPLLRRIRRIHADAVGRGRGRASLLLPLLLGLCATVGVAAVTPGWAARHSAAPLVAGDIEQIRLVVVRAPASPPGAPAARGGTCRGVVLGERA